MRIFIVKDDGLLERLAFERYIQLLRHDAWEPSPEIEAAIRPAILGRIETGRS